MKELEIESLKDGIPFITDGYFALYKEKCMVSFTDQGHKSGVKLALNIDNEQELVAVTWKGDVTPQLRDSHSDSKKNTEDAACAIALLLIREYTTYTAYKTTDTNAERVDYYLKPQDEDDDDMLIFNNAAYLEVSGIRKATQKNSLVKRCAEKVERLKRSEILDDDDLVYVCIVEFGHPSSIMVKQ